MGCQRRAENKVEKLLSFFIRVNFPSNVQRSMCPFPYLTPHLNSFPHLCLWMTSFLFHSFLICLKKGLRHISPDMTPRVYRLLTPFEGREEANRLPFSSIPPSLPPNRPYITYAPRAVSTRDARKWQPSIMFENTNPVRKFVRHNTCLVGGAGGTVVVHVSLTTVTRFDSGSVPLSD